MGCPCAMTTAASSSRRTCSGRSPPGNQGLAVYVREPQGNGIAERFVRILKENLLWVRCFQTVEDLRQGLSAFKETYNTRWRVGRHGCRTPEQYREKLLSALGKAA